MALFASKALLSASASVFLAIGCWLVLPGVPSSEPALVSMDKESFDPGSKEPEQMYAAPLIKFAMSPSFCYG